MAEPTIEFRPYQPSPHVSVSPKREPIDAPPSSFTSEPYPPPVSVLVSGPTPGDVPSQPTPPPSHSTTSISPPDRLSTGEQNPDRPLPPPSHVVEAEAVPPIQPHRIVNLREGVSASAPLSGAKSGSKERSTPAVQSGKSRKSSCDLCHHRKIRCDQGRPACGSCVRKGHICRYSDGDDSPRSTPMAKSSLSNLLTSSGPTKVTLTIPNVSTSYGSHSNQSIPTPRSERAAPEWSAVKTSNSRMGSPVEHNGGRNGRRERIANGFDSSDDEARRGLSEKSNEEKSLGDTAHGGEEVDELESLHGDTRKAESVAGSKRSADDELNGELLELASGPPKKKKPRPTASMTTALISSRPQPVSKSHRPNTIPGNPGGSRMDPYAAPLQAMLSHLPSSDTQSILFNTFFTDPFLTEGISLLQPQYLDDFRRMTARQHRLREGDATTVACAFAFLAAALRILPEETSRLLLAQSSSPSHAPVARSQPRSLARLLVPSIPSSSDHTPLDQRYFDLAILAMQVADQWDMPSVMLVMCKLTMVRFLGMKNQMAPVQSGPMTLAGGWLAGAIKIAHTLGMGKEWEGINQGERELRRRVMWSLYIADRHWSFITANPYTILDAHQGIHLPSPISEADLYKIPPDSASLPSHNTESGPTSCTALFIHTHLARRITPILDSFATISPSNTPHDLVIRFDSSLDAFQEALPPYFRLYPHTETTWDSGHSYLAPHRVRLHATLLSYRMGVHRAHLPRYLLPATPSSVRSAIAAYALAAIRTQRSAKMLDPKLSPRLFNPVTIFESAVTLALIMYVEKITVHKAEASMIWRGGVVDAEEMLDNVTYAEGSGYSRKAVKVLREIMARVTKSPASGGGYERRALYPDINLDAPSVSAGEKDAAERVTGWLERLLVDGMRMEMLLREPEWEGAWEKVVLGM